MLATHWAVMPDQKTIYYKLDPDVKWNDGVPVTADDYVFAFEMLKSKFIIAPYTTKYIEDRFETVEKIDDYTIKIVGKRPSWRALYEYNFPPLPRHATKLDETWVKRTNWESPVCVGSHMISDYKLGKSVTFERVKNWWGDKKRYLKGRFNFNKIIIKVVRNRELGFQLFKKGELSVYTVALASGWVNDTDFEAVKKGWVVKKKFYNRTPNGMYGIFMNLTVPLFQNKNIRKAFQHLFDFETYNEKLMYGAYKRKVSISTGTIFANPNLKPYEFSIEKALEYLKKAGFVKRGDDGILVKDGQRLSVTLTYSSPSFEKLLSVMREDFKKAGVELDLKRLDGATAYKYGMERNYQMIITIRTAGLHPSPLQFFHSKFAGMTKTNNITAYANPVADKLIDTYEYDLNANKRLQAMYKLDALINDEAFIIPFWYANYYRVLYWNEFGLPDYFDTISSTGFNEFDTIWFDEEKYKKLKEAMKEDKSISLEPVEDDPHGVK